jgi:hypothetical protein
MVILPNDEDFGDAVGRVVRQAVKELALDELAAELEAKGSWVRALSMKEVAELEELEAQRLRHALRNPRRRVLRRDAAFERAQEEGMYLYGEEVSDEDVKGVWDIAWAEAMRLARARNRRRCQCDAIIGREKYAP